MTKVTCVLGVVVKRRTKMIYDVVNVIKNVGNIAIEGVSKTLLNGLLNDKE